MLKRTTYSVLSISKLNCAGSMPCTRALYEGYLLMSARRPLMPHLSASDIPASGSCTAAADASVGASPALFDEASAMPPRELRGAVEGPAGS